jgi:hypothetical protein
MLCSIGRSGIYSTGSISYDLLADEDEREVPIFAGTRLQLSLFRFILIFCYSKHGRRLPPLEGYRPGRRYLHEDAISTLAWPLIGKFYNRYSCPPVKTPSCPETVPLRIWHEFCLCSIVHPLAKGRFQSRSCSMVQCFSSSIVAYDEQDYDAFA